MSGAYSPGSASSSRQNQNRRRKLADTPSRQGLDYLELLAVETRGFRLRLHFIPHVSAEWGDVPPGLGPEHLRMEDERGRHVRAEQVTLEPAGDNPSAVDATFVLGESVLAQVRYRPLILVLTGLPTVDPPFSRARFQLELERDTPPPTASRAPDAELPPGTYLARDFESFSRLLLDRLRLTVPAWHERHTADLGVMLVEMMAHAGDLLSYYQDAAAAEAYLGTARRRTSLRRHARLLDYTLHEGCNARTWMALQLNVDTLELPAGSRFYTSRPPEASTSGELPMRIRHVVFESLAPARLHQKLNTLELHTWGAEHEVLPAGATSATLAGHFPELRPGDVLIFEELREPTGGLSERALLTHRHAVRLSDMPEHDEDPLGDEPKPLTRVKWSAEDALPFPLTFGRTPEGQPLAQVLGNVVLVDQGATYVEEARVGTGPVEIPLHGMQVSCAEPLGEHLARHLPASATLHQEPTRALPCVSVEELREDTRALPDGVRSVPWTVREDLLSSDRYERHFVAELGDADALVLRFGNGQLGRRPRPGTWLRVRWRSGLGPLGNVAPDTVGHLEGFSEEVASVRNPLSAVGGQLPEDAEKARRAAPQDFRTQERAVTEEDYTLFAQRLPEVRQAVTLSAWNGSTSVARVHVLPQQGREPRPELLSRLQRYLSSHSLLGTEVEVRPPELVPLDILLHVGVQPGRALARVRQTLEQELGSGELPDGRLAFFHPSAFRLGQPAYLAPVVARAASVPGVAWVQPLRFQRWGQDASSALDSGRIPLEPTEVVLVEGQPGRPDLGLVRFHLVEGRP